MKCYLTFFILFIIVLCLAYGEETSRKKNLGKAQSESEMTKSEATSTLSEGYYKLKSLKSNRCIEKSNSNDEVIQSDCVTGRTGQSFHLQVNPRKGGNWFILKHVDTGKLLDLQWGSTQQGAKYWLYSQNWTPAQNFQIYKGDAGNWLLKNERSDQCLSNGNNMNSGAGVIQWGCHGQLDQQWEFVPVQQPNNAVQSQQSTSTNSLQLDNSWFQIINSEGRCLYDPQNGQEVKFSDCNDTNDGLFFKFSKSKGGKSYRIVSAKGNSLSFKNGGLTSAFFKTDDFQKFVLREKNGKFKIRTKDRKCINNVARLVNCESGNASQRFRLSAYEKLFVRQ